MGNNKSTNKSLDALLNNKEIQKAESKITKSKSASFDDYFEAATMPVTSQIRAADNQRDILKRIAHAKTMENKKLNAVGKTVDMSDVLFNIIEAWKKDHEKEITKLLSGLTEI